MKKLLFAVVALAVLALPVTSCVADEPKATEPVKAEPAKTAEPAKAAEPAKTEAPAAPTTAVAPEKPKVVVAPAFKNEVDQISYCIGVDIARNLSLNLQAQGIPIDRAVMAQGFRETMEGKAAPLSDEALYAAIRAFQEQLQTNQSERMAMMAEKNKKEAEAFFAENAKKDGVKTTDSGLQYKVIKEGEGASPTPADKVTVNYRGTYLDGTLFDTSARAGKPAEFQLGQVVPGWIEGLQKMKAGGKAEIWIPSKLGYGEAGKPPTIGPNAALHFEVELVKVEAPPAPPPAAPAPTTAAPAGPAEKAGEKPADKPADKPAGK